MTRIHCFDNDALGDHDAVGLVGALHSGEVSVPEVVDAAIARTEKVAPDLGAVASEAYDRARAAAREPRGGFFAGVPTFVKDNVDVAGMPTRHGTDAFEARPAPADGDFARLYLATGLIPLGKTQLSEFGFSASAEHPRLGPVRCPWDTTRTAGASSSGSAALVAAGAVPLAHANDGGGSIRIPAAVNGLVGLKPSRDRLPQDRLTRDMPVRIVADGVVTRSVRDTAAFFREAERIWRNPRLPRIGDVRSGRKDRLRIALITTSIGREMSPLAVAEARRFADQLSDLGHHVEEVDQPVDAGFDDDFLLYWAMLSLYLLRTGRRGFGPTFDRTKVDNLTLGLARHCRRNLHRVPRAIRRIGRAHLAAELFFQDWDLTLAPTLGHATPPVGHLDPTQDYDTILGHLLDWVTTTPWDNASGCPAISLPVAADEDGLPMGMQLGAPMGQEQTLLEIAYEVEEAVGWRRLDQAADDVLSSRS